MYVPPPGSTPGPIGDMRARLRPMGIGDILDETFRLYRANFTLFVATCAVLEVPVQIVNFLIRQTTPVAPTLPPGAGITNAQMQAFLSRMAASGGAGGVVGLLVALASVFITAALAVVISNRYLSRTVTVGEAYRATLTRIGSLLLAIIWIAVRLIAVIVAIGIIAGVLIAIHLGPLAVVVGLAGFALLIYFLVSWALISQVIMLENVSGGSASRRSRELIRGHWWKTLGVLILVWLLVTILTSIPTVVIGAIVRSGVGTLAARLLITGIVGLIVGVLVQPITIAATTLLFYDLKIRKEAFDLEAMVQQAGAPPPTVPYQ
jgi:hypothetical protein